MSKILNCVRCGGLLSKIQTYKKRKFCGNECFKKYVSEDFTRRFWSKVDKKGLEECWEYTTNAHGYARVRYKGISYGAHVLSLWSFQKRKPRLFVLHSCDNPKCVNPRHLREGTQEDNEFDKKLRSRHARGEKIGCNKLTETQIVWILEHPEFSGPELAEKFGVGRGTINKVRKSKTWMHVPRPQNCVSDLPPRARYRNKLTKEQAIWVINNLSRFSDWHMSKKLGVHYASIYDIRHRKTWKHLWQELEGKVIQCV